MESTPFTPNPNTIAPMTNNTPSPSHPALPKIIGGLVVVILVAIYLIWANSSGTWPYGTSVSASPTASASPISNTYENESYGFSIALPATWQGYTAVTTSWNGTVYDAKGNQTSTDQGPLVTINFPGASDSNPHEAMPVMVFTIAQWNLVSAGNANPPTAFMAVSAAPIGPSELARNSKYVFALPARYNFDYKPGYEEVDTLVHTLKSFELGQ